MLIIVEKKSSTTETDVGDKFLHVPTKRISMGNCQHIYGKVTIFIGVERKAMHTLYKIALDSIRCYTASTGYELKIIDIFNDERVNRHCSSYNSVFFRRHCAVKHYLDDTDWMLVIDADTGVVNPNHCIEEYIDDRVDIIFYERFFNWEFASGNYLIKNTKFAKNFLQKWADYDLYKREKDWWNGLDNGVLHILIMELVLPKHVHEAKICRNIWYRARSYETYVPYVICVRTYLGATRLWPRKIKILRRGHSFCRDRYHTNDAWCKKDFMLHGWKDSFINVTGWESPFYKEFDLSKCGANYNGWFWRKDKQWTCNQVKGMVEAAEREYAHHFPKKYVVIPFLNQPDVGDCYPDCDIMERIHGL